MQKRSRHKKQRTQVNASDELNNKELRNKARKGCVEAMKILIKNGAKVNAKDRDGNTALHYASKNSHHNAIELLIEHSAEVNAKDRNGNTALHYASKNSHHNAIELLIKHSAEVNAQNNLGLTPLHMAAETYNVANINTLIKHGANPNAYDNRGRTPLLLACKDDQAIKALVTGGAYYCTAVLRPFATLTPVLTFVTFLLIRPYLIKSLVHLCLLIASSSQPTDTHIPSTTLVDPPVDPPKPPPPSQAPATSPVWHTTIARENDGPSTEENSEPSADYKQPCSAPL